MARVTNFSVQVRYSKPMPDGSHKTVELGCEATLNSSDETWQEAQATLYKQLGEQMRHAFNGSSNGKEGHQTNAQPAQAAAPPPAPPENWCSEHGVTFKARNGPHGEFFSHQIKGTRQWCNQSRK